MKTLTTFALLSSFAILALSGCGSDSKPVEKPADKPAASDDHGHEHGDGHDHDHADGGGHDHASLPLELEVVNASQALAAGKAEDVQFVIRNRETGKVETKFDTVHEEKLHLIVVDEGLSSFQHVHPVMDEDGFWTQKLTLPSGGRYLAFADGAMGGGHFSAGTSLVVDGAKPPASSFELKSSSSVSGITADVMEGQKLALSDHAHVTIKLSQAEGWEPYLGETGHLILISQDGREFIHAHAKGAMQAGVVTFDAHFHAPGLYRAWAQFQRGGKVLTFPFTLEVGDAQ